MDTSVVWEDDFSWLPQRAQGKVVGARIWDVPANATLSDLPRAVYVIGPEGGPYKVGISNAPERRIQSLSRDGRSLRIWGQLSVPDAFAVERAAHRRLASCALGNEWFDCTLAEAVEAVTKAAEIVEHEEN